MLNVSVTTNFIRALSSHVKVPTKVSPKMLPISSGPALRCPYVVLLANRSSEATVVNAEEVLARNQKKVHRALRHCLTLSCIPRGFSGFQHHRVQKHVQEPCVSESICRNRVPSLFAPNRSNTSGHRRNATVLTYDNQIEA